MVINEHIEPVNVYCLRYYDWDIESGATLGIFHSFNYLLAFVADEYSEKVKLEEIKEPTESNRKVRVDVDGGDYGKRLEIEMFELE